MKNLRQKVYGLLRKSEGFFKTDMVYLAKGSFWLNSAQIGTAFISFLLAIGFANLVPQDSYGTYKYILSLAGIIGIISLSGIGTAVARAVARGNEGEFIKAIRLNLKWESLVFLASLSGALYYYFNGNNTLALGLLIIGVFSPIKDSAELYPAFLTGRKNFRTISVLSLLRTVISAVWLFVTITLTTNPIIITLSYFVVHTAANSVFTFWVIRRNKPNNSTDAETRKLIGHTSILRNFGSFYDQLDNILIFHYFGPISLAVYNFAQAMPEYLAGFTKNINSLAIPKFSQASTEEIKNTLIQKSLKIFLFGAFMASIYILLAPIFFDIFFPKYLESVKYSQIYSITLIFSSVLPISFLDSRMAIREKYILSLTSNLIGILSVVLGVIYFGVWGAILARVSTKIIGVGLAFYLADNFVDQSRL